MKSALAFTSFSLGASASVIAPHILPREDRNHTGGYWFRLVGNGHSSAKGPIGQLNDGQNRIGGGLPLGDYVLEDGRVWDKHNRGCILTPPTTQWQCDEGAAPTKGFEVDCSGNFMYKGSTVFYACPVNDNGEWNIYSKPAPNQAKCVQISLTATGTGAPQPNCASRPAPVPTPAPSPSKPALSTPALSTPAPSKPAPSKPADDCVDGKTESCAPPPSGPPSPGLPPPGIPSPGPPPPGPQPSKPAPPAPTASKNDCDDKDKGNGKCHTVPPPAQCSKTELGRVFEYPHFIVPVDEHKGHVAIGNKLNGTIEQGVCTIYNFDIHPAHEGKQCSIIFLLPKKEDLETSNYTLSGNGSLIFTTLHAPATPSTTWDNKPSGKLIGQPIPVKVPMKAHVGTTPCKAGHSVAVQICQIGDLGLNYFQDFNPQPIGLYINVC